MPKTKKESKPEEIKKENNCKHQNLEESGVVIICKDCHQKINK